MDTVLTRLSTEEYPLSVEKEGAYDRDIRDLQALATFIGGMEVDAVTDYSNFDSVLELKRVLTSQNATLCESKLCMDGVSRQVATLVGQTKCGELKEMILEQFRQLKDSPKSPARSPDNCYDSGTKSMEMAEGTMKNITKAAENMKQSSDKTIETIEKLVDSTNIDKEIGKVLDSKLDGIVKDSKTAKCQQDNIMSILREFCDSMKTKNNKRYVSYKVVYGCSSFQIEDRATSV